MRMYVMASDFLVHIQPRKKKQRKNKYDVHAVVNKTFFLFMYTYIINVCIYLSDIILTPSYSYYIYSIHMFQPDHQKPPQKPPQKPQLQGFKAW